MQVLINVCASDLDNLDLTINQARVSDDDQTTIVNMDPHLHLVYPCGYVGNVCLSFDDTRLILDPEHQYSQLAISNNHEVVLFLGEDGVGRGGANIVNPDDYNIANSRFEVDDPYVAGILFDADSEVNRIYYCPVAVLV